MIYLCDFDDLQLPDVATDCIQASLTAATGSAITAPDLLPIMGALTGLLAVGVVIRYARRSIGG